MLRDRHECSRPCRSLVSVGQSTALGARFELFSAGFNSAHRHLIEVTHYLFFGAAELPQASLDLFNSRPGLYFLDVSNVVLFHGMRVGKFTEHPTKWALRMQIKSPKRLIEMSKVARLCFTAAVAALSIKSRH